MNSFPQHSHNPNKFISHLGISCITAVGLFTCPVYAQSISIDGSTPTTFTDSCITGNCTVMGGSRAGSGPNLFHSFSTFNVETNRTVTFDSPTGVSNIFSRVTDLDTRNLSYIDGTLAVNGSANLYLLNPNGILFGENAQLDLQGSFLSSTADSLLFDDGTRFSAIPSSEPSALLTVSVPIGLQFGAAPGPVELVGTGHNLTYSVLDFTIDETAASTGLIGASQQTLAFLGNGISLQGANITAPSGHVEIASLGESDVVSFDTAVSDWKFNYSQSDSFGNVHLSQASSVSISGPDAGSIHVQGREINLLEGSALFAKIESSGDAQLILDASERLMLDGSTVQIIGTDPSGRPISEGVSTGAYIEIGKGATGNGASQLIINAPNFDLSGGAQAGLGIGGAGSSGEVVVRSSAISATGGSPFTPSSIYAAVLPVFGADGATGTGGSLDIRTQQLSITEGAQIVANTFGAGNAGNLQVTAADIEIRGYSQSGPSSLQSSSEVRPIGPLPSGSGSGGNLSIRTDRLTLSNVGQIAVSTKSPNPAGSLTITATEAIELSGEDVVGRSGLFASAINSSGTGGIINIKTPQLTIAEGATINASNTPSFDSPRTISGTGPAGSIIVAAENIALRDGSLITADTVAGNRSNISLSSNTLTLREGSRITTNALGSATGGNVTLNTSALVAVENSDITANSTSNFGGRVFIEANAIVGTEFREQVTSGSDITASSELGEEFSGTVEIEIPKEDPADGIATLPENLNSDDQVIAACSDVDVNTFVMTGRAGRPEDATQLITAPSIWNDFRGIHTETMPTSMPTSMPAPTKDISMNGRHPSELLAGVAPLTEAQTWSINAAGEVVLSTYSGKNNSSHTLASCLSK